MSKKKNKINEGRATKNLKAIIWTAVFLSLLVPLIYSTKAMFPFAAPRAFFFMAMVQIMFFAWLLLALKNERYRPKMSPVTGVLAAFMAVMILSTLFGADPAQSFWSNYERMSGLLMHIHLFAFFLVLSSFLKGEKDWIKIISIIAPVASLVSLISIAHILNLISLPDFHQNGSTLGNTSFMGSYLLVAAFFCLYAFLKSNEFKRVFYGLNFAAISAGILLNPGGRAMKGGFLAGMILLLIIYLAFSERKRIVNNISKFLLFVVMSASIFVGLFAFMEGSIIREKIDELHGMSQRFIVWDIAIEGFKERPILGWGPENFHLVFEKGFDPRLAIPEYVGEVWFDRAHNVIIDSLVIVGILGTFLFFGIFVTALFVFWKEYLVRKKIDIWVPATFTSLFVAHSIQNLTVFDMTSSYMLMFILLAFAASLSPERDFSDNKESSQSLLIPVILVVIMSIASLYYFTINPYRTNLKASIAVAMPIDASIEYYEEGIKTPIAKNETILSFTERLITNTKKIGLKGKDKEAVIEKMEFAIRELDAAINRSPSRFRTYWMAGRINNEYFDYYLLQEMISSNQEDKKKVAEESKIIVSEAINLLKISVELSPRNQQGYWDLAQAEINMGKIHYLLMESDQAQERFTEGFLLTEKAVELEPRYLNAHLKMLMVTKDVLMDLDLTREKAAEALEINPSWEPILKNYLRY